MEQMARRFWLTIVPLIVGLTAVGLLVLAAYFPNQLYDVGSRGYIATAGVGLVSLGLLVWQVATHDGPTVGGVDRQNR